MAGAIVPPEVGALLDEACVVPVATVTPSGAPALAAFWHVWDGAQVYLGTERNATVRNLERSGCAAVLVDFGVGVGDIRGALLVRRVEPGP